MLVLLQSQGRVCATAAAARGGRGTTESTGTVISNSSTRSYACLVYLSRVGLSGLPFFLSSPKPVDLNRSSNSKIKIKDMKYIYSIYTRYTVYVNYQCSVELGYPTQDFQTTKRVRPPKGQGLKATTTVVRS